MTCFVCRKVLLQHISVTQFGKWQWVAPTTSFIDDLMSVKAAKEKIESIVCVFSIGLKYSNQTIGCACHSRYVVEGVLLFKKCQHGQFIIIFHTQKLLKSGDFSTWLKGSFTYYRTLFLSLCLSVCLPVLPTVPLPAAPFVRLYHSLPLSYSLFLSLPLLPSLSSCVHCVFAACHLFAPIDVRAAVMPSSSFATSLGALFANCLSLPLSFPRCVPFVANIGMFAL